MTYKRSGAETRGRKRVLTRADVVKMNKTRLKLIDDPKIGGKREVQGDRGPQPLDPATAQRLRHPLDRRRAVSGMNDELAEEQKKVRVAHNQHHWVLVLLVMLVW